MPRYSFRNPVTHVLTCHGFTDRNREGEIRQEEDDDFDLAIGKWMWSGTQWVRYSPPPLPKPLTDALASVQIAGDIPMSLKAFLRLLVATLEP